MKIKAGFDPNQVRDPHTGEWIDMPGLPSIQMLDRAGTPTPDGMPDFNQTLHGSARAALDDKADPALEAVAKAHEWPDGTPIPIRPVDGGGLGAFSHSGAGIPNEIRVEQGLSQEQTTLTLTHEMGHYLDNLLGNEEGAGQWAGFLSTFAEHAPVTERTEVSDAMNQFLAVARGSPTMREIINRDGTVGDYLDDSAELWARAYTQWIHGRTDVPDVPEGGQMSASAMASWPDVEFAPIRAAVEAVLRAKGLL